MKVRLILTAAFALASAGLVSCGADPSDMTSTDGAPSASVVSNKITGSVEEWKVEVSAQKAEAGEVIFAMANYGSIAHEFLVTKTSYEPGMIPVGDNNRFDEEGEGVMVPGEIPEWEPGTTGTVTLKLDAGNYQLLCNIAGHYKNGMYTQLTVS